MKSKLLLAIVAVMLALPFVSTFAQTDDDPGTPDTVAIVCSAMPTVIEGDSVAVELWVYNDESLGAFSLGFTWLASENVEFSSWTIGPAIPTDGIPQTNKTQLAANKVLIGWITFNPTSHILATPGGRRLFGTMYFKALPGAVISINPIDSSIVGGGGVFSLTKSAAGNIYPQYDGCDVRLPVQEMDGPVLPQDYALDQNQPNPFNPTTTINFALPRAAKTKIEIYNILGQKVITLVDEYLAAGNKRVEWNGKDDSGNDVASGIYLYRMTANDYTETKKMMLMK